jgi:aminomuconate-semialdehyde/2-hydroxymuconate-6-semialdehyde dehydrogenase
MSLPLPRLQNFIGNVFSDALSGLTLEDVDPATGRAAALLPRSGAADVEAAVRAARAAAPGWAATPAAARAALLDRLADAVERRAPELARLEAADAGKTLAMAAGTDIPRAAANLRFFAGAVRHDATAATVMGDGGLAGGAGAAVNYSLRVPVGICGLITPWNLPLYLLTWKVAPALACGNCVVAKPSEITPRTAHALAEIALEVGLPPGVLNVVHGLGSEAGAALVEHADVRCVSFTGGTATGALVARAAAPLFKKISLELGGKNSTIIFADFPLERAVAAAVRAGFTNNGQVCLCGSRVLVQRALYDAFVPAFAAAVAALRVGAPLAEGTDVGPVSCAAHRDKVLSYIRLAREEGGAYACGGPDFPEGLPEECRGGFFVRPTVVTGLAAKSHCSVEEIFGPVVTVHAFEDEAEAVEIANNTRYGLATSVWTLDLGTAHRVARKVEVGIVWVNCWLHRDLRTPFGGVKDSGIGREGGPYSLDFYSELKNVCIALS